MSEIINIDEKYSVEIVNQGSHINLLRYKETWVLAPAQSRVWIAAAYKIDQLTKENEELKERIDHNSWCYSENKRFRAELKAEREVVDFYGDISSWWWSSERFKDLANRIIQTEDLSRLQKHNKHSLCGGKLARERIKERIKIDGE